MIRIPAFPVTVPAVLPCLFAKAAGSTGAPPGTFAESPELAGIDELILPAMKE